MTRAKLLDGRLKLRHLVLADALTDQGSVVAAAVALHVTQPVVSRGLRELEEILGVQLYDRGPRGITPTEFGIAFTDHARAVLAQLSQTARHMEEIASGDRGQVFVGTHLAGSNLLLPRAIVALKRERPLLSVIVREATPEALQVELSAGRVDLVVSRLTQPASDLVHHYSLYKENIRLVVGHRHPLAHRTAVELAEATKYPWILPGTETVLRKELEALFVREGADLPSNRVEATSFLTVRQLLVETDMVAALPGLIGVEDPQLVPLPTTLESVGHTVGIAVARGRRLNPAAQALITALERVAAQITETQDGTSTSEVG